MSDEPKKRTKEEILLLVETATKLHADLEAVGVISIEQGDIHVRDKSLFLSLNEGRKLRAELGGTGNNCIFVYGEDSTGRQITWLP